MNVRQLQQALGERKLAKRGKKTEIVNLLIASLQSNVHPSSNAPPLLHILHQDLILTLNVHEKHVRLKLLQSTLLKITPSQTLVETKKMTCLITVKSWNELSLNTTVNHVKGLAKITL